MTNEIPQYPEVEIDKIIIPQERARAYLTPEQFEELKASIKEQGFRVPIIVRQLPDGRLELVDGENRIKACKELGITKVPYILADSDEKKAQILNFQANWIRGFQNPVDVAECLLRAYKAGATIDDLAKWTGHTKEWVNKYLVLNELPEEFKDALRKGLIPVGVIWEAARLEDPDEIYNTIRTAIDLHWTVREVANFVEQRLIALREKELSEIKFEGPQFPSLEEAMRMARLRTCGVCQGKYDMDDVRGLVICKNCLDVLAAASEISTNPAEAAKFIKEVVQKEKERALYEELKRKFENQ